MVEYPRGLWGFTLRKPEFFAERTRFLHTPWCNFSIYVDGEPGPHSRWLKSSLTSPCIIYCNLDAGKFDGRWSQWRLKPGLIIACESRLRFKVGIKILKIYICIISTYLSSSHLPVIHDSHISSSILATKSRGVRPGYQAVRANSDTLKTCLTKSYLAIWVTSRYILSEPFPLCF